MPTQKKFTDEEMLLAISESYSMVEASKKLGVHRTSVLERVLKIKKKVRLKNGKIVNQKKEF